ncbi:hypothetical protein ACTXT7_015925 [Hymenolepis weldensis]
MNFLLAYIQQFKFAYLHALTNRPAQSLYISRPLTHTSSLTVNEQRTILSYLISTFSSQSGFPNTGLLTLKRSMPVNR